MIGLGEFKKLLAICRITSTQLLSLTRAINILSGRPANATVVPSLSAALVSQPTITVASANPTGSTPTTHFPVDLPGAFTFGGYGYGPYHINPATKGYGELQSPNNAMGFGAGIADFYCDAPIVTFSHARSQGAVTRIWVDGVEQVHIGNAIRANTATGGTSNTIILDAAAGLAGVYFNQIVAITSGTGAGQWRQITIYSGLTKTATVSPAWTTAPDATSKFEITPQEYGLYGASPVPFSNSTNANTSNYITLTYGEKRMRHYRVEHAAQMFFGVWTPSVLDTVAPAPRTTALRLVWAGDSFAQTYADGLCHGMPRVVADTLGMELLNVSQGGTGMLNPNAGVSFTLPNRLLPPVNAWRIDAGGATGGTFTITQGGVTTGAITFSTTAATIQTNIQSACDTAFGAGAFSVIASTASSQSLYWLLGTGATATVTTPMTITSSLTGGPIAATIVQYLGDLADRLPVDITNTAYPFLFVLAIGHNDTTQSNAAYTPAALQAATSAFLTALIAKYPMAMVVVVGGMYLPGGSVPAALTAADAALLAAATATLPTVNGIVPFVEVLTSGLMTGTGYLGTLAGNGNSDATCGLDGVHPTPLGHQQYGGFIGRGIQSIYGW